MVLKKAETRSLLFLLRQVLNKHHLMHAHTHTHSVSVSLYVPTPNHFTNCLRGASVNYSLTIKSNLGYALPKQALIILCSSETRLRHKQTFDWDFFVRDLAT